jgi:hypothetical protein
VLQFISEFLTESIETLEHIANEKKPPLTLGQLERKLDTLKMDRHRHAKKLAETKASLEEMDAEYLSGRGDLSVWTTEILAKLDAIFVVHFIVNGEPVPFLFAPNDVDYLNTYDSYRNEVDELLASHEEELPTYCREYFLYSTMWEMRGLEFPVPLGTETVVHCLHKICCERRKGFVEVRNRLFLFD